MHLLDQFDHHEQGVPREISDERMMGGQNLVDLLMAWMMMVGQKMMRGAKKDDR
jgi:hypothetical protein